MFIIFNCVQKPNDTSEVHSKLLFITIHITYVRLLQYCSPEAGLGQSKM